MAMFKLVKTKSVNQIKVECGPMYNAMAALPNTGGALCSTPQSVPNVQYSSAVHCAVRLPRRETR